MLSKANDAGSTRHFRQWLEARAFMSKHALGLSLKR
jgi:hypothetical protein